MSWKKIFETKSLAKLLSDANDPNLDESNGKLKRHLGKWNLTFLGIGAIIGAGIFSITGTAAAHYAGPGVVYSFIIGGILCVFAGLCYAEMAAMVPVSGSAYAYSYTTLGEFVAWIIGWDLILEYAFGAVTVSIAWSGYLTSLITKTLGVTLSDSLLLWTKGPWDLVTLSDGTQVAGIFNIPASFVGLLVAVIIGKGIKESVKFNNLIVILKVIIILSFIIVGWGVVNPENWVANPQATGMMRLVAPELPVAGSGSDVMGWLKSLLAFFGMSNLGGVFTASGILFFAYIGFDAVSTTAQEAKDPQKDLPFGILVSLVVCTVIYIAMSLTMTGVVSYKELGVPDPVAVGVDRIITLREWGVVPRFLLSFSVKLGALAGLTSVILVMMLAQTRIFYAMSRDGLLPWFSQIHKTYGTPLKATVVTGLFVALCGGLMSMSLVGELVSIGTLLAFVLVCFGVIFLRQARPELPRPFRVPAYYIVAPFGIAACLFVMASLPEDTWLRLIVWLMIGFALYFFYGIKHSKLRVPGEQLPLSKTVRSVLGGISIVAACYFVSLLASHHI